MRVIRLLWKMWRRGSYWKARWQHARREIEYLAGELDAAEEKLRTATAMKFSITYDREC